MSNCTCSEVRLLIIDSINARHIQGLEAEVNTLNFISSMTNTQNYGIRLTANIMGTFIEFDQVLSIDMYNINKELERLDFRIDYIIDEFHSYLINELDKRFEANK